MALKKIPFIEEIKVLIFDLDDTLFDTFGQLVKPASRESCQAMINAGLKAGLEECLQERVRLCVAEPRTNIYAKLVSHFGVQKNADPNKIAETGFETFHTRDIKENIFLFPDARETLQELKKKYLLYLVTLGSPDTQRKKIDLLKLEGLFKEITIVDVHKTKSKKNAFQRFLEEEKQPSASFVSIGNRLDSEIRDSKELGMNTILMLHGEYIHLQPADKFEIPDATIKKISDLKEILL